MARLELQARSIGFVIQDRCGARTFGHFYSPFGSFNCGQTGQGSKGYHNDESNYQSWDGMDIERDGPTSRLALGWHLGDGLDPVVSNRRRVQEGQLDANIFGQGNHATPGWATPHQHSKVPR